MNTARQVVSARHREGDFTEDEVLFIAARRDFTVSKYRWGHSALRKLTRRMRADGKLELVGFDGRNFYYRSKK